MRPGMVFTIEPMINKGNPSDQLWPDNWTVVTTDGKRSAQFEHTLLVTEDGLEILTASPKYYDTSKPVTEMLPFDRNMFQRNYSVCWNKEWSHDSYFASYRLILEDQHLYPPTVVFLDDSVEYSFLTMRRSEKEATWTLFVFPQLWLIKQHICRPTMDDFGLACRLHCLPFKRL